MKLDIAKHTIQQQDQALVEKEREAVRRVQAAREEEFTKFAKVENDKLVVYYSAIRSLYRHIVSTVPVSCKANGDRNQFGAWLDRVPIAK